MNIVSGFILTPNLGSCGTIRDKYCQTISNLGGSDNPKRSDADYEHPNWDINTFVDYLNNHTKGKKFSNGFCTRWNYFL